MAQQDILDTIDREIAKLQQIRNILEGDEDRESTAPAGKRPEPKPAAVKRAGRPKGTKRQLSDDARARIAAAQKKRWAAKKETPDEATAE